MNKDNHYNAATSAVERRIPDQLVVKKTKLSELNNTNAKSFGSTRVRLKEKLTTNPDMTRCKATKSERSVSDNDIISTSSITSCGGVLHHVGRLRDPAITRSFRLIYHAPRTFLFVLLFGSN